MDTPNMHSKTQLAAQWHQLQIACLPGTLQEAVKRWEKLGTDYWEGCPYPPSPVGSTKPSDLQLFRHHKKHSDGKQFATHANTKQAVNS